MWSGPAWPGMWLLQSLAGILERCEEASLFSPNSLPLNFGHKAIKNSSTEGRQSWDQIPLLFSALNPGSHNIIILLNLNLSHILIPYGTKPEEGLTCGYKELTKLLNTVVFFTKRLEKTQVQ